MGIFSAITSTLGTVSNVAKAAAPAVQLGTQLYGMYTGSQDAKAAGARKDAAYAGLAQTQEDARKMMKFEAEKYKDFKAIQEYLLGVTKEQLAYAKQMNDPALYQKTMQVYRDILAGNFPAELFDRIKYEMDEGTRQQLFDLNQSFRHARQELANHVPPGGARTDMLADMAREYGDKRAAVLRQVGEEKRKAILDTYTELYGKATAAGEKQPEDMLKAYTVAMEGARGALGPEGDPSKAFGPMFSGHSAALTAATSDSQKASEALAGITSALTQKAGDATSITSPAERVTVPRTSTATTPQSSYKDMWQLFPQGH